ncbi:MAG: GNAT family N-acetyltransferase [Candidatus Heimdallarchaeota archaeon]|nr:MAG: GNAT family N-acetyltransferase [Candidatus Heimdallarchaeota archaeon]
MKFREATSEDQTTIRKIARYAFSGHRNMYEDPNNPEPSDFPYSAKDYVVEDFNTIIAITGVIKFSQRLRGSWIKMAGMTRVACRPEYRRQGYMGKLFQFVFKKIHEENFLVSALYPFTFHFYEKLGYGQVDSLYVYTIKSTDIIQRPISNRTIVEDFDPNYIRCQPLYEQLSQQIDGLVKRPANVWKNLDSWNWTKHGFQFICQDSQGRDMGYLLLRFERKSRDNPFPFLDVREMVYFDPETKQAFLNFLANHDSQREYIRLVPFEHNFLPYLKSPRMKENKVIANSMFRIVNVEQLLPRLKCPKDIKERITIELEDPSTQCPWNNRAFTLEVTEGQCNITTQHTSNNLRMGIKAFSQVLIGFHSPMELAEVGQIQGSTQSIAILARIFPKQTVILRDYF